MSTERGFLTHCDDIYYNDSVGGVPKPTGNDAGHRNACLMTMRRAMNSAEFELGDWACLDIGEAILHGVNLLHHPVRGLE